MDPVDQELPAVLNEFSDESFEAEIEKLVVK
jgi:hypothetical protein